jgi:hypothetical protein
MLNDKCQMLNGGYAVSLLDGLKSPHICIVHFLPEIERQ